MVVINVQTTSVTLSVLLSYLLLAKVVVQHTKQLQNALLPPGVAQP